MSIVFNTNYQHNLYTVNTIYKSILEQLATSCNNSHNYDSFCHLLNHLVISSVLRGLECLKGVLIVLRVFDCLKGFSVLRGI